jgi:hypothetical protein
VRPISRPPAPDSPSPDKPESNRDHFHQGPIHLQRLTDFHTGQTAVRRQNSLEINSDAGLTGDPKARVERNLNGHSESQTESLRESLRMRGMQKTLWIQFVFPVIVNLLRMKLMSVIDTGQTRMIQQCERWVGFQLIETIYLKAHEVQSVLILNIVQTRHNGIAWTSRNRHFGVRTNGYEFWSA